MKLKNILNKMSAVLIIVLGFTLMGNAASGQTPPYFNASTQTAYNLHPFNHTGGMRYQSTIAASSLTGAPAGIVDTLWFKAPANASRSFTNLTIGIRQTAGLATGAFTAGPFTTIFTQASFTASANALGWVALPLTTPYNLDPALPYVLDIANCGSSGGFISTGIINASSLSRSYSSSAGCTQPYFNQDNLQMVLGISVQGCVASPPTATLGDSSCSPAALTLNASGTDLEWFADSTSTTVLDTGAIFNTPLLSATDTFWVAGTDTFGLTTDTAFSPAPISTYPGGPRGYWFVAPVDFTMTGVYVSTASATGAQHVGVYRKNAPYSPTNHTNLFYANNQPAGSYVNMNVAVATGDSIFILGCRVGSSPTVNAYATAANIMIDGNSVPIVRVWSNDPNFQTTNAVNVSAEPQSSNVSALDFTYEVVDKCESARFPVVAKIFTPTTIDSLVASPALVCAGSDATIQSYPGIGASGFSSMAWSPSAGLNTASGDSVIAQAITAATAFQAIGTDANGCMDTASVTVNIIPGPTVLASAADPIVCSGDTTLLSATGADTYVWSPGALTGANVSVSPTTTTTYIVTGTDTTSMCSSNDTITVGTHSLFYVNATASPLDLCLGDTTNLLATDSNLAAPFCRTTYTTGTGSGDYIDSVGGFGGLLQNQTGAGPAPYYQLFPTPIAVSAATPYTVTVRNGTYSSQEIGIWIDYNQDSTFTLDEHIGQFNNVASNASVTFTVNIPTSAYNGTTLMRVLDKWSGNTPVMNPCGNAFFGETEDYVLNISGGTAPPTYSYAWMPGSLSGAVQTLIPTASTTYTVTQTNPITGCEATDSVLVNVLATPTLALSATPSATVCTGDTVTLMSGATGATSYTWNGAAAGMDTILAPATSGTYTVVATNSTASCSATDSIVVTVNPNPVFTASATPTTICENDTAQLGITPALGATSYTLSTITHAPLTPTGTPTPGPVGDDNTMTVTLPFAFNFYGQTKTNLTISTNGFVNFGASQGSGCCSGQVLPSGGINDVIAICWADMVSNAGGIDYFTEGTAPNRQFVVRFTNLAYLGIGNGTPLNGQIILNENNSTVEIQAASGGPNAFSNTTMGIENSTGTLATVVPGRNSQSPWSITNEAWLFTPDPAYAWSPSLGLSSLSIADPMAAPNVTTTYTVAATVLGCTSTDTVTVNVIPRPTVMATATPDTICAMDTVMLAASGTADTYTWNPGALAGATHSVVPTTTTSYVLMGTDTVTGCSLYDTALVVVNPLPILTVSVDSNETCPGEMNGGATALALSDTLLFFEGFINATTNETAVPTPLLLGWTRSGTAASPRWEIDANGSSSTSTSPASGNNTPGYIFMETSSPAASGQTDTLISPAITIPSVIGNLELKFFTHMYGADMGTMTLLVDDGTTETQLWTISGQQQAAQTSPWDSVVLNLNAYAGQTINLRYVGVRAGGFDGDMSIDDIEIMSFAPVVSLLWSTSDTTNSITGLTAGTYTVTATTSGGCTATDSVTIATTNSAPTLALSATPSAAVCAGDTLTLLSGATGATSYTWNGLAASIDTILAPATSGTYTVVATNDTTSCSATDSIVVTVNAFPVFTPSATPDTLCAGDTVQLNTTPQFTNNYILSSITHAPLTPTATPSPGPVGDDNTMTVSLPFSFDYYGQTKTSLTISTNGFVNFGASQGSGCCSGQVLPNTSGPNDVIAIAWEDLNGTTGDIDYFTEGTAPNRKFVVRFNNQLYLGGATEGEVTGQIILNETANTVEIHGTSGGPLGVFSNTTMGIENSTGTLATVIPGRNSQSPWSMTNEGWLFSPSANPGTTMWTSTASLSDPSFPNPISNPSVTSVYNVSVTQNGCTAMDSVAVVINQLPMITATATPSTICAGDTAALNGSSPTATTFTWEPGALAGLSQNVTPGVTTDYILSGADANGCIGMDTVAVLVNPLPILAVSIDSNASCPGSLNGGATAVSIGLPNVAYTEGFVNSFTVETALPNAALAGWTTTQTASSPRWSLETNGTGSGYGANSGANTPGYVYLEASSPASVGQTDTLISPSITVPSGTGLELKFFTHMFGGNIGSMLLYIDNGTTVDSMWSVSGQQQANQAAAWDSVVLNIDAYAGQNINLRFVGIRGASFDGDAALDDIQITSPTTNSLLWSTSDTTNSITGLGAGTYTVTATNNFGCMAMDTAIITSFPAATITVTPTPGISNCLGGSVDLIGMGANTYVWMPGSATGDTLSVPAYTGSNTYMVTGTDSNGCTDTASVVVTQTIPSGALTQATVGNTASNPGSQTNGFSHPNNGLMYSYFDTSCAIIASVQEAAGGIDLGYVSSMATVEAIVPVHNAQPYLARWFEISPSNQGPADVTLYVTQDDFNDYNAVATTSGWPLLPIGSTDLVGIANVAITKNDNGGLGVNPIVIAPNGVVWNNASMRWEITFSTPGFSQFRVHAANPNNAALPVSYKNFTVTKQAASDLVQWTTVSESNNSHFNVQRSADGHWFENLGMVSTKAQGGVSALELNYSFVDEKPMIGHNYYRLQQVDIDHKESFTKVIDIIWGADGSVVSIYPNPATHVLNIDLTSAQAANTEVKLVDMSGRVVNSISMKTSKGLNHMTLNLGEVATGVYGVQIFENNRLTNVGKINKK